MGSYPHVVLGAVDPNYTISYVNGSVDGRTRRPLSVTASSASMTYGGTVPSITPSYAGFVNGDTAAVAHRPADLLDHGHVVEPGGHLPQPCSGAADPNYTFSYVTGTVEVDPALAHGYGLVGSMTYGGTPSRRSRPRTRAS